MTLPADPRPAGSGDWATPTQPAPIFNPYEPTVTGQPQVYPPAVPPPAPVVYQQAPSVSAPVPSVYPQPYPVYQQPYPAYQPAAPRSGLYLAAAIINWVALGVIVISTLGIGIVAAAWMVPMTILTHKAAKDGYKHTALAVCTLLFCGLISGILMLVDEGNRQTRPV